MKIRLLALATAIEAVLAVLALFGGPHGELGGWPWALQMPGILLMLSLPGETGFAWRAAGVVAIQVGCWYAICGLLWRIRARRFTRHLQSAAGPCRDHKAGRPYANGV